MKKYGFLLLAMALLLAGCGVSAGSDYVPTATTQPTQPAESTSPTSIPVDWDSNSLLTLLPKLREDAQWELSEYHVPSEHKIHIKTYDVSLEEVKAYVQVLADAGFNQERSDRSSIYTYHIGGKTIKQECYIFSAQNQVYDTVWVNCEFSEASDHPDGWECRLMFLHLPDDSQVPPEAVKNESDWNADPLLARAPQPPTEYWSRVEYAFLQGKEHSKVKLDGITMAQVREYAATLREAGFTCQQYELSSGGVYEYSAVNADGYVAEVSYSLDRDSRVYLLIYPESVIHGVRWRYPLYMEEYLPNPEELADDWICANTEYGVTIKLYGMDYHEALEYITRVRQRVSEIKWKFQQGRNWVQDEEKQYLNCTLDILWPETVTTDIRFGWILIYDPTNTECPCMLVKD